MSGRTHQQCRFLSMLAGHEPAGPSTTKLAMSGAAEEQELKSQHSGRSPSLHRSPSRLSRRRLRRSRLAYRAAGGSGHRCCWCGRRARPPSQLTIASTPQPQIRHASYDPFPLFSRFSSCSRSRKLTPLVIHGCAGSLFR